MRKRGLLALLLCGLLLPVLTGTAESMEMMGYDAQSGRLWEDNLFFERMEEETGLSFAFSQYQDEAAYQQAKEQLRTGQELPDVLFKADLTPLEERELLEEGVLLDLAPLLEEHAPHLHALLEEYPAWREAITQPDGRIAALPMLSNPARQVCLWLNRAWLDALGLSMPITTEELRAVLSAFAVGDPNGNGKADEVPLLLTGPWEVKWLAHAFGLVAADYNLYLDGEGQVQFAPVQPEYMDFLAFARTLQEEGLLGSEAFRQSHALLELSESETDPPRIGGLLSFAPYLLVNSDATQQYDAMPPLAYEGQQVYRDYLGQVWRGTFALTTDCADPAAALRWVDYLYTPEGAALAYMGLEGEDWDYVEEPLWNYLMDEYRSYASISAEALISESSILPGIDPEDMWRTVDNETERHVIAQSDLVAAYAKRPMPQLYPDAAQWARIGELQQTLGKHVDVETVRFITGERPLDEAEFETFRQELSDLGMQEMVELWQQLVDARYRVTP